MQLLGRRQARYEALRQRAEEANRVKDHIHEKMTDPRPGDRALTRRERRILGRGLGDWEE